MWSKIRWDIRRLGCDVQRSIAVNSSQVYGFWWIWLWIVMDWQGIRSLKDVQVDGNWWIGKWIEFDEWAGIWNLMDGRVFGESNSNLRRFGVSRRREDAKKKQRSLFRVDYVWLWANMESWLHGPHGIISLRTPLTWSEIVFVGSDQRVRDQLVCNPHDFTCSAFRRDINDWQPHEIVDRHDVINRHPGRRCRFCR